MGAVVVGMAAAAAVVVAVAAAAARILMTPTLSSLPTSKVVAMIKLASSKLSAKLASSQLSDISVLITSPPLC